MRVLAVEDDALLGDAIQAGLKQAGFAVDWVKDGVAAQHALEKPEHRDDWRLHHHPDALLHLIELRCAHSSRLKLGGLGLNEHIYEPRVDKLEVGVVCQHAEQGAKEYDHYARTQCTTVAESLFRWDRRCSCFGA